MRIAYVIPAWPPLPSQPFVVNEMVEVEAAGHELTVLGLYRRPADSVRHGTFERLAPARAAALSIRYSLLALWSARWRPLRVPRRCGLHAPPGRTRGRT
jgi:hypothetical protein